MIIALMLPNQSIKPEYPCAGPKPLFLVTSVNMNPFHQTCNNNVDKCIQMAMVPNNACLSAAPSRQNEKTSKKVKIKGVDNTKETVNASNPLWLP
ncbi:hypothetical protein VISP3789_11029 [Vibrio splendidus ATCC 33789]|nr:hypothetical protein VISP3789_11029 [Vibrio splendidus ATCC 33789]